MDPAIPTVAIHGVGRHEPGRIEAGVTATVERGHRYRLAVSEFNWDQRVDHRSIRSPEDALDNMVRVSASFHGTASAALRTASDGLDQRLSQIQLVCCSLLRRVLAGVVAAVFGIPALIFVVLFPAWAVESGPFWPSREAHWVALVAAPAVFSLTAAVALAVVGLGCLRAVVVRSLAPIRNAITASALTCLSPVMMVLTAPLSVSWLFIGALVCFFGLFGLVAFGLYWLLPNGPVFTVFDDFTIAPYVLGAIAILALLQGVRFLLARAWHEGPVKILLDITRYVGEPEYRHGTLRDLAGFVHDRQADSPQLVIVAHSLGSVIALDYLCNWRTGDSDRDVTLITLGSPYRRFFLRWLPGVLFDRRPVNTVRRIRARHRSFRWVNVYRPWDYVGTSLPVPDAAFANRSTRQFLRLNGHGNYWGDDVVLSTIEAALATLPSSAAPRPMCRSAPISPNRSPDWVLAVASPQSPMACVSGPWPASRCAGWCMASPSSRVSWPRRGRRSTGTAYKPRCSSRNVLLRTPRGRTSRRRSSTSSAWTCRRTNCRRSCPPASRPSASTSAV